MKNGVIESSLNFILKSAQCFSQNITQIAINCKSRTPITASFQCCKEEYRTPAVFTADMIFLKEKIFKLLFKIF